MTDQLQINERFKDNLKIYKHDCDFNVPYNQYIFRFDNGYGASVIKGFGTYGRESDLWELAVIRWIYADDPDEDYKLTYQTEITDDVVGYLTDEKVNDILEKIKNL